MNFFGKRVAVLGLAMEGQDLCRFLVQKGALITGFDVKNRTALGEDYKKLKSLGISFSLGNDYLQKGLSGFEIIFRSPGVKLPRSVLAEAVERGTAISTNTQLFFDLCPGKIIGVTGTKGKGTTATLIYKILKKTGRKVFLLGNIGLDGALETLPKIGKNDWVVFELSSFQLQDLTKSPHVAVVLFITSEHLDHHGSTENYIQAKTPIVRFQAQNDFAVLSADNKISAGFSSLTPAAVYFFSRLKETNGAFIKDKSEIILSIGSREIVLGKTKDLKLIGEHNWENITAAVSAACLAGADLKAIRRVIFSFTGLEHRLEFVAEAGGARYYNDSFSTTPETAVAALRSFKEPIILIAGGSEKGSDFTCLGQEIACSSAKTLILIGEMTARIEKAALKAGFKGQFVKGLVSMKEVVKKAKELSSPGDIVLLSPACASFDMFLNYKDRGHQFKKYVSSPE